MKSPWIVTKIFLIQGRANKSFCNARIMQTISCVCRMAMKIGDYFALKGFFFFIRNLPVAVWRFQK